MTTYIWIGIEVGTFASAAGGGKSEQKGVAAVEILRAISEQEISGTATGHNGAAPCTGCSVPRENPKQFHIIVSFHKEVNIYGGLPKLS